MGKSCSVLLTWGDPKDLVASSSFPMDSWMKPHRTDGLPLFILPHSISKCRQGNGKLFVVKEQRRAGPGWRINLDPDD
jgi:hypothetical protein